MKVIRNSMNYIKVKLDKEVLTNAIKNMSEHELLVLSTNYPQDYYSAIQASKKNYQKLSILLDKIS